MTAHKAHCLILPCPLQGRINPMLQFCKRLQSKGVKITIAPTKFFLKNMQELPTSVSIEAISDGYDDGGHESFVAYTERFKEVGSDSLSQLIEKLTNFECPVNCLVYDPFLPWAVEVPKNFGLVTAAFFTQSCAVDNIYYHVHKGVLKLTPTHVHQEIVIPGFSCPVEHFDLPTFVIHPEAERILEMLVNQFSNLHKVDCVLINSFNELENELNTIDWMDKIYPIKTIGPTIPSMYLDKRLRDDKDLANVKAEQMEELAWGLKNSNKNFLWVVRSSEESKLPKNFLEEIKLASE
ncbi:hypothetical protein BC332_20788, partial [Capsicum chinense]